MFEGESADMCAGKCSLVLSGGSRVCRPGSEDPIGASGNFSFINDQTVKGDGYTKFTPQIPDNVKYNV